MKELERVLAEHADAERMRAFTPASETDPILALAITLGAVREYQHKDRYGDPIEAYCNAEGMTLRTGPSGVLLTPDEAARLAAFVTDSLTLMPAKVS